MGEHAGAQGGVEGGGSERNSCWVGEFGWGGHTGEKRKLEEGGERGVFSFLCQWNKLLLCLRPVQSMLSLGWAPPPGFFRHTQIDKPTKTPTQPTAILFSPYYWTKVENSAKMFAKCFPHSHAGVPICAHTHTQQYKNSHSLSFCFTDTCDPLSLRNSPY